MRNRPKRKSLRRKLIVISIASFLLALLGLFIIYYYITYVLQLPGTGAYQFANVLYAIQWVVSSTPWMLWFLIACPLVIGIFYRWSRRTMKRLDRVSQAVQNVVEGDYHPELPEYNRDEIGTLEQSVNRMAEEIEHAFAVQRQAERMKDEFITNIAHDLKTPLMSITGYLTLIDEEELSLEKVKEYAAIANAKSKRMEKLVNDLFTLSRLTTRETGFSPSQLSIKRLLMQVQDESELMVDQAGMELRLFLQHEDVTFVGDGDLLFRVFDNLIVNGIRYAREGRFIDVIQKKGAGCILVSVVTHANPIPKEELEHVFDRLYRLEKSRSEATGGTGFGLPISRGIVELHGGSMQARQTFDGTAFDIMLPLEPPQA